MNYLHNYKTFDSVQELNYHVKQHTNKRYYDMNETERQVLQLLSQYSVKFVGVSHLRIQTIATAVVKSYRTIIRAIKSLVELSIIEKLSTTRRISGGQGANIYRILPYVTPEMSQREVDDKATPVKDSTPKIERESAISLSYKELKSSDTYTSHSSTPQLIDYTTSYSNPYSRFKEAVTTFIGNDTKDSKSLISKLYGVYLGQTKHLRKAYDVNKLIDVAIQSIQATFHATKRKDICNIPGYFNGALSNKLDDLYTELMAELMA